MSSVLSENWVHCAKTVLLWTTFASCCGFAKQREAKHAPADGPEGMCVYTQCALECASIPFKLFFFLFRGRCTLRGMAMQLVSIK